MRLVAGLTPAHIAPQVMRPRILQGPPLHACPRTTIAWVPLARSPTGMHGQNMASGNGVTLALCSPPPVLAGCGSMLRCASAYSRSGRSSLLDAAFHSPAATADLATSLHGRVNAPDLHLRSDSKILPWPVRFRTPAPALAFCRLAGHVRRTKPVAKFDFRIPWLSSSRRSPSGSLNPSGS
jgi:hypothetical protein